MNIIIGFIGLCAAALLIYYVYILMKGDEQNECGDTIHTLSCRSYCFGDSARRLYQESNERRENLSFQNSNAL